MLAGRGKRKFSARLPSAQFLRISLHSIPPHFVVGPTRTPAVRDPASPGGGTTLGVFTLSLRQEFVMSMRAFLRSFFAAKRSTTIARPTGRLRFKPALEVLEDRLAPA